jgi:hypothetical protein
MYARMYPDEASVVLDEVLADQDKVDPGLTDELRETIKNYHELFVAVENDDAPTY